MQKPPVQLPKGLIAVRNELMIHPDSKEILVTSQGSPFCIAGMVIIPCR